MSGVVYDYTSRIPPGVLKSGGGVGVCRYLAPDSALWKRITPAEYRELVAAGLEVFLNWEFDARDWMSRSGATHGTLAGQQAQKLGYPLGSVIFGSCDFDVTAADWSRAAEAYARDFARHVRGLGYRPGVYGPWDAIEWCHGIMDCFWQAGMSHSWSGGRNAKPHPAAHLFQDRQIRLGALVVDENLISRPLAELTSGGNMPTPGPIQFEPIDANRLFNAERMLSAMRDLTDPSLNPGDGTPERVYPSQFQAMLRRIDMKVGALVDAGAGLAHIDPVAFADSLSDSQLATLGAAMGTAMADRFATLLGHAPK